MYKNQYYISNNDLKDNTNLDKAIFDNLNIYSHPSLDFLKAENLIHISARPDTFFIDENFEWDRTYYYVVTALDRVNNESPPSNEIRVTIPQYVMTDSLKSLNAD